MNAIILMGQLWVLHAAKHVCDCDHTLMHAYRRDENFRKLLATGRYVYVQGHFCINDPKYVEAGLDGEPMMTRYGNEHINECCLKFETVYSYDKERYLKDGILHNEAFKRRKSVFLSGKTDADVTKEEGKDLISHAQDARDLHLSLPVDFGDALEALQKRYGMNNDALAYAMGVTPNTITIAILRISACIHRSETRQCNRNSESFERQPGLPGIVAPLRALWFCAEMP